MVLSDLCQVLGDDWEALADKLGVSAQDIEIIKQEVHTSPQRTSLALKLWQTNNGTQATGMNFFFLYFWYYLMLVAVITYNVGMSSRYNIHGEVKNVCQ